tara:strand:- start:98 stop:244 length:147 start_codon:yes stop_codon:yes gene_type:complete
MDREWELVFWLGIVFNLKHLPQLGTLPFAPLPERAGVVPCAGAVQHGF